MEARQMDASRNDINCDSNGCNRVARWAIELATSATAHTATSVQVCDAHRPQVKRGLFTVNEFELDAVDSDSAILWGVIMDAHESGLHELAARLTAVAQQQQHKENA